MSSSATLQRARSSLGVFRGFRGGRLVVFAARRVNSSRGVVGAVLRTAFLGAEVLRTLFLRIAVLRDAFLPSGVLRVEVLRPAVFEDVSLRPVALAALRAAVFGEGVFRDFAFRVVGLLRVDSLNALLARRRPDFRVPALLAAARGAFFLGLRAAIFRGPFA